jgi:Recombination endonuclease VII
MKDGHRSECKTCHKSRQRQWYQANRVHAIAEVKRWQQQNKEWLHEYRRAYRQRRKAEDRDAHLRRTFGITQADYEELLARQGGGCGICGRKPGKVSLHVDHDHATGEIRGLLCVGCNNALGQFRDDPGLLTLAADYVSCDVRPFVDELELLDVIRDRARELQDVSR